MECIWVMGAFLPKYSITENSIDIVNKILSANCFSPSSFIFDRLKNLIGISVPINI